MVLGLEKVQIIEDSLMNFIWENRCLTNRKV